MPGFRLTRARGVTHLRWDGVGGNALGRERYEVLARVGADLGPAEVLLLSGAGRHFCAGQDLAEWEEARCAGTASALVRHGAEAVLALLESEATSVVALQGAAVGAGVLLAAAADVVLLAPDARLRLPELEMGMPLGESLAARLVGSRAARRMLLTGDWVDAGSVAALGGARIVDQPLAEAQRIATTLAGTAGDARAAARTLFGGGERSATAVRYRRELAATLDLLG